MAERFITYAHIKRPSQNGKSNAYAPTLCGLNDSGRYAYVTLGRDQQIEGTAFPICTDCAAKHIDEDYKAVKVDF